MKKMKALGSIYIGNLDPKLKEKILSFEVDHEKLKKFEELEKLENVSTMSDLKEILNHTETEVLNTLNNLYYNSQFFTYCGPMLININPGPGRVYDYLNLQKWMTETTNIEDAEWKPHLYSYINYIYQNVCKENKDQVVNMLGQVGSGKTFNLVHIIEYLTLLAGPENLQVDLFDMIHKSIQLIHIMGSIYRQNNVESTCCALLLKIGFDDKNKIAGFDIESKIVDFTLPFSENGRSYTILHALMCANPDLKKTLELPENEQTLNFFKKFHKNFDVKTKEKFKMNDMEIWTRFHSLLNYFGFQKNEILEILQLLSFIILLNECAIGKKKYENYDEYFLNKSSTTKKVAKNLNISEDDFLIKIGVYKSINDVKAALIKLMKYTYFLVFEYIKMKVKRFSTKYFEILREECKKSNETPIKNLYFIDIPSEIGDQTLGGLSTNLSNECLNLFASNQYLTLVEKLEKENINLKYVKPLHCVDVVNSLIGENGLARILSKKFNDKFFYKFKSKCNSIPYLRNTIEFSEPDNVNNAKSNDQFVFKFKFSQKSVVYNLESLSLEAKSMSFSKRLMNIIEMSNNKILRIIMKKDLIRSNLLEAKTFFHFIHYNITEIFSPLKGLSPFLIYCFHSNNSLKIFFGEKSLDNKPNWNIPENLTKDLCKHSLLMPVLYWEWFGYHEWISIDKFVADYADDFENIKEKLIRSKGNKGKSVSISFSQLKKEEICHFILTILIGEKQFIIGRNHILLKKGFLKDIRKILDNLNEMHKINRKTASIERKETKKVEVKENTKEVKNKQNAASGKNENESDQSKKKEGISSQVSLVKKRESKAGMPLEKKPTVESRPLRKNSLKILCHYNIINDPSQNNKNEGSLIPPQLSNYSLYKFLTLPEPEVILNNSLDVSLINMNENKAVNEVKNVEEYTKKNHVIVVNNMNTFNLFKNVLVQKTTNFELFDYSDYQNEITRITSCFRAYKARKKYKIFRYCIRKIILLQKYIRAWVIRNKFIRFLDVSKKVTKIQICFKKLLNRKIKAVLILQRFYRNFKIRLKEKGGEMHIESENKENSKLADELFEVGNLEKEKRKNLRSLSKIDIDITESKFKKPEINEANMLDDLMNMEKNFLDESIKSMGMGGERVKKIKKRIKGEKRIEDRLLNYGENLKKKISEMKFQKLKEEETELIFKPKTNFGVNKSMRSDEPDFFQRLSYYKNKYEMNIEEKKNKKSDMKMTEYTFKPKLSKVAQLVGKRTVEDLYNWKYKKEENLNRKLKEKEIEEDRKYEEDCRRKYRINSSSEIILQQKMERMSKIENNDENAEIDLWPVQMQKTYFEKNKQNDN